MVKISPTLVRTTGFLGEALDYDFEYQRWSLNFSGISSSSGSSKPRAASFANHASLLDFGKVAPQNGQNEIKTEELPPSWMIKRYSSNFATYKNKLSGQAKGSEWESQLNFSDSDILSQQWEFVIKSPFVIKGFSSSEVTVYWKSLISDEDILDNTTINQQA